MGWVTRKATLNGENGIRWKFTNKLDDIDFADDIALMSSTKQEMQIKTNLVADEASRVGLDINKQKTKVMRINTRNQEPIFIGQEELQEVDRFVYLGATMTKDGGGMGDIANRIGKARCALIRLQKLWVSKSICRRTKIRLYKTLVLPVLLYGCETWKMNKGDEKKSDIFHNKCLRRVLGIRWQERVSTKELLKRAKMGPLSIEIKKRRWKFIATKP
ncbi:hypothetical protein BSL78_23032 [Apostichopus japonicus]|uniref:Reverse transcriptase domain-containing protein n=1 Tax=Stichopus japonicus TaxID=307972 RepID=A0A2G8JWH4_STIJA|nr:hypothetical protein BSL78_23032 [Apostichopus japonicus]